MRRLAGLLLVLESTTASAAPPCLSLPDAVSAVGATEPDTRLTPPLPVTWPPSGPPAVRFFDFRAPPLPTGVVAYGLDSPSVELVVPLDGAPVRKRALGKRTRLGRWSPGPERTDLEPAGALLLRLSCERRMPTEAEAVQLRDGYRAWLLRQPLLREWLGKEAAAFVSWVAERPAPPPGTTLGARLEGEAVVLSRGGTQVRFVRAGLQGAQLTVVPLRADGSDPALWITLTDPALGPVGLLVAFANPPVVLATHTSVTRRPGLGSTSRSAWLVDVDHDGFNDLVEHATGWSDVGAQSEGVQVRRFDPLEGSFVPGDRALEKRAPRFSPDRDPRVQAVIARALRVPEVELRGRLDGFSQALTGPAPTDNIGGGGTPPFVGLDALQLVMIKKKGQPLGGQYQVVQVRFGAAPMVIASVDLGGVGYPMNGCEGRHEEFRREGEALVVVWPTDQLVLVEQRLPWSGQTLGQPMKAPVKVASCRGF